MPHPNPKGKTYLLKGVPVDIYEAALAKAAANRPPLSMRWVLITLLEKWVGHRPPSADGPKHIPKRKTPRVSKKKAAEQRQDVDAGSITVGEVEELKTQFEDLDLSDSF